jgi:hypothetical protein
MSQQIQNYLSEYIIGRIGVFKTYLLAALENRDECIMYLESSEGMFIPSADLKNCELLRDAGLFSEDTKLTRNGRNSYKIYCLTKKGKEITNALKEESWVE